MKEEARAWTYILASARNGTLYTGSTRLLAARVQQHRDEHAPGFTRKYGVKTLVWFEAHDNIGAAYKREQRIKRWRRAWKLELIEELNPRWEDLYPSIAGFGAPLDHVLRSKLTPLSGRMPRESGAESRDPEPQA
jgi:putative endonuclease